MVDAQVDKHVLMAFTNEDGTVRYGSWTRVVQIICVELKKNL